MSDFQTMDDFAVFVNDYLTPEQVIVKLILMQLISKNCLFS